MSEAEDDTEDDADEKTGNGAIHTKALERFAEAMTYWSDQRAMQLDDLRFGPLGKQWPDAVVTERTRDNRPMLTINRLPAFARQVINDARLNKPTIRCRPVDSVADPKTAEVMNGLIRHIEAWSEADAAYDTGIYYSVWSSIGYWRVNVEYAHDDSFDYEIKIDRISNPLSVLFDPRSDAVDSQDWRYCFVTDMVCRETFETDYPDAEPMDWDTKSSEWFTEDSVRIAEYWVREPAKKKILKLSNGMVMDVATWEANKDLLAAGPDGQPSVTVVEQRETSCWKVTQYMMSGAEILKTTEWAGQYIPIVPVFGDEVNVDGKRHFHSLIYDAKDAQRNFNYWRTKATEAVALAPMIPYVGRKGAFETDAEKWATANTKVWSFIEYDGPERPERTPYGGIPAGAIQEALNASDDLKATTGMHDASLGARSNETSGVAIRQRQKEGDVSNYHFIDNLTRAIRCTGRIVIDIAPHVYGPRQTIRILGEDGKAQNVPLGTPTMIDGIMHTYDLTVGKYDLIVEPGPSFSTRREEAAAAVTEFIRAAPQAAPLMMDIVARNSDWPEADKIADRLEKMLPPQLQPPPPPGAPGGPGGPPLPPPPPPPEVMKAQADMAMKAQSHQQDMAQKQQSHDADIAMALQKAQIEGQAMVAMAQAEAQAIIIRATAEARAKEVAGLAKAGYVASINEPIQ